MICIGGSSGSIGVLQEILRKLPTSFDVSIAIVLHRHPDSTDVLMRLLRSQGMPALVEPYDKDRLSDGAVYLAPPDYHMLIEGRMICLSVDPPEQHARPSIDILFESVAGAFSHRSVGIVLSGASADGAAGAWQIDQRNGRVIVQDPKTAKNPVMPQATLKRVPSAQVLNAPQIATFLQSLTRKGPPRNE